MTSGDLVRSHRVLAWGAAIAALGLAPCAQAQQKAPPEACAAKLDAFMQGQSQDVAGDVEWFGAYCDAETHEKAVNAVGEATMEAALKGARQSTADAARQAKLDMAAAHSEARAASAGALMDALSAQPTVVVVGGPVVVGRGPIVVGPRPGPPPRIAPARPAPTAQAVAPKAQP